MRKLVLVDVSSYLYRAFYALPDLRGPDGTPTGAMHGMVSMLKKLRSEYEADYCACVFDAKGKTFRDDIYAEYKAYRAPMPDDLVKQIEPIHALVRAMGWPLIMMDGVEADDVIGTLARIAAGAGIETVISTGDKDLAQLVGPHVTLINTMSNERLDPAAVVAKFGVPPERIVDYLTLMGDTVDNVPGVEKLGPKTAAKWITEFGSLDGVMANAGVIQGAAGEGLRKALNWLPICRTLMTVKCDVKGLSLENIKPAPENNASLSDMFRRYGFRTWLKELADGASGSFISPEAGTSTPARNLPDVARGYVYVLSNHAMPGLLKVGYTTRTVRERIDELSSTGVPKRFRLELLIHTPQAADLERKLHATLAQYSYGKEFFKCDIHTCVLTLKRALHRSPESFTEIAGPAADQFVTEEETAALEKRRIAAAQEKLNLEERRLRELLEKNTKEEKVVKTFSDQFLRAAFNFDILGKKKMSISSKLWDKTPGAIKTGTVLLSLLGMPLAAPFVMTGMAIASAASPPKDPDAQAKLERQKDDSFFSQFSQDEKITAIAFVKLYLEIQKESPTGLQKLISTFVATSTSQVMFRTWGPEWQFDYGGPSQGVHWRIFEACQRFLGLTSAAF